MNIDIEFVRENGSNLRDSNENKRKLTFEQESWYGINVYVLIHFFLLSLSLFHFCIKMWWNLNVFHDSRKTFVAYASATFIFIRHKIRNKNRAREIRVNVYLCTKLTRIEINWQNPCGVTNKTHWLWETRTMRELFLPLFGIFFLFRLLPLNYIEPCKSIGNIGKHQLH